MTPPASRYGAAISTYLTRPGFQILAVLTLIDWFILAVIGLAVGGARPAFGLQGLLGAVFYIVLIIALLGPYILFVCFVALMMQHLRQQLTARVHLIPGFLRPHLHVCFGALVLVPVFGMFAFLICFQLFEPAGTLFAQLLGILSVLLFAVALTAWMASFRSAWAALLMVPLALLAMTCRPLYDLFRILMGGVPSARAWQNLTPSLLLTLDVLLLAVLFSRLNRLTILDASDSPFSPRPRKPKSPIHLRPHRTLSSPLIRAFHRRSGILSPWAPWTVAFFLGCLLLIVTTLYSGGESDLLRSILLPTIVPGVVISLMWRERWMNLGYESLYPADRDQFLQELLGATAISLAELWLATALAVIPPILLHNPHLLTAPIFLVTMTASAAMQVLVFGIMFLSALCRPMLPYVNVITILAQVIPISFVWADSPELSQRGLLVVAAFQMLIGILITAYGYRGWRTTDLA
jgi:hypothetical protein